MAEYIDKARFLEYIRRDPVGRDLCERHNLDGAIEAFPAADVAEVVRCKDCKYREDAGPGMVYCPDVGGCVREDFFCADGERTDDGRLD